MSFDELLAPMDTLVTMTRNGTPLSRYSESIVKTFVHNGANCARVRVEKSEYDFNTLYDGMRRVAKKNDYKGIVEVHKQDGNLVLIRRDKKCK